MAIQSAVSAVNRFGLGARGSELDTVASDPRGWLRAQLQARRLPSAFTGLPDSAAYLAIYARERMRRRSERERRAQAGGAAAPEQPNRAWGRGELRRAIGREVLLRQQVAVEADDGFAERIVRFWSNHFAISVDKRIAAPFAAPMEREAIRPHAFGHFADLLLAVERHPGMLLYLDNVRSIGADSRLGALSERRAARNPKARRFGLNENLAREIMELHTLGVHAGYSQEDVREFAKVITGWSLWSPRDGGTPSGGTAFVFRAAAHEPGARTIFGKRYAEAGQAQGEAVLRTFALHPATAGHLALKLARHFVADSPPPALVERMARAYLDSDGALPALYAAMIDDDAAWTAQARKFKTPDDFLLSSLRACDLARPAEVMLAMRLQGTLGQPLFQPRSPAGFGDVAGDWGGPDALFKRVQAAQALAERAQETSPEALGRRVLGAGLDATTALALRRAESTRQGVALLLASPAFQWRA